MADPLLAVGDGKPLSERTLPEIDPFGSKLAELIARPVRNQVELGPDLGRSEPNYIDIPQVPGGGQQVVDVRDLGPRPGGS
jgi:hypothetical protein